MNLKYSDIKKLIESAIKKCPQFSQCRITEAYPTAQSDSPVKRTVCAVGLLSAEKASHSAIDIIRDTENTITAFADIYTPVSKGGQLSSDCALALCDALGNLSGKYSIKAFAGDVAFLSNCHAYKTRVKVTVSQSFDDTYIRDIDVAFNLFFDDSPYVCRSTSVEISPTLSSPIECYGEGCPVGFVNNSRKCILKVKRYIPDDYKSLKNLQYPFTVDDMLKNGIYLTDCAVTNYVLDRNMQEIVTISGRTDEDAE